MTFFDSENKDTHFTLIPAQIQKSDGRKSYLCLVFIEFDDVITIFE